MADTRFLFSTPFVIDRLQSPEGIKVLRDLILAQKQRDPGVEISNVGGWHSKTDMIDWGGEAARALAFKAMTMADEAMVNIGAPEGREYNWHPDMWANVSTHGNSNQYHTHPGSFWSAVAYIDDGYEGSSEAGLGGELQLLDPRSPIVQMASLDLKLKDIDGREQKQEPLVRPQTGLIVMFPSWLQHSVRPFYGTGTRISIAINLVPALTSSKEAAQ